MEGKNQSGLNKEFGHYAPMLKCLNPYGEIDTGKILEEGCEQNLGVKSSEDAPIKLMLECLNPIGEIDAGKILEEGCEQNLGVKLPEDEDAHIKPMLECLNPFGEIDAGKILEEGCMQNLGEKKSSEDVDAPIKLKLEYWNPFDDIDAGKILEEGYFQNLGVKSPEVEDAPTKTITVDMAEPIPLLEDINYTVPDLTHSMQGLSEKEHIQHDRNILIRLQSLYMYEYRYLLYKYQVGYREFLLKKNADYALFGPLKKSKWDTEDEHKKYREYKLLSHYHNITTGQEALIFKTAMERRKKATLLSNNKKKPRSSLCKFSEMGVTCTIPPLPSSKFCSKHILNDRDQLLFRACGVVQSNNICHEPIVNFDCHSTCVLHEKMPKLRD